MVEGNPPAPAYRLYTRWHVELATLLATAIGGALLLRANFARLGRKRAGRIALLVGTLASLAAVLFVVLAGRRGISHALSSVLVESTFLVAAYIAFDRFLEEALRAHRAAGGQTGPWWHALGAAAAGLGIFALVLVPFQAFVGAERVHRALAERELALMGGERVVLTIDLDRGFERRADRLAIELEHLLASASHGAVSTRVEHRGVRSEIEVLHDDAWDAAEFDKRVPADLRHQLVDSGGVQDGRALRFGLDRSVASALLSQTAESAQRRFERLTNERVLSEGAGENVIVILPAPAARAFARYASAHGGARAAFASLLATAQLMFKMVDDEDASIARLRPLPPGIALDWDRYEGPGGALVSGPFLRSTDRSALAAYVQGRAPARREFALQKIENRGPGPYYRTWLLHERPGLTGEYVTDARVAFDSAAGEAARPYVQVTFSRTGADIFGSLTAANVKRRMAIVLDDNVDSAPVIQSAITGGICSIHLGGLRPINETLQEAKDLALLLKSGALAASVSRVVTEHIEPGSTR